MYCLPSRGRAMARMRWSESAARTVCTARGQEAPVLKPNYLGVSDKDVANTLSEWGYPKYRVKQIREWVYERNVLDPTSMKDLPHSLRDKLSAYYSFGTLQTETELISARDGTVKRLYRLRDNSFIESVLMPYEDNRQTACVSSQVGCAMNCSFCATGQMGFGRQLSDVEIFEQTLLFSSALRAQRKRLSNVVFMGMGEPLNNYKNVMKAVRRMNSELGIGSRHITISTVGIVPRIRQLAEENLQCGLAVSLHHVNNTLRSALMPVNDKYPIESVLEACVHYINKTKRRISFEWALVSGVTDTYSVACDLGSMLKGMLCHVNLIPLNPTKEFKGEPSTRGTAEIFVKTLASYGVKATIRVRRGLNKF